MHEVTLLHEDIFAQTKIKNKAKFLLLILNFKFFSKFFINLILFTITVTPNPYPRSVTYFLLVIIIFIYISYYLFFIFTITVGWVSE